MTCDYVCPQNKDGKCIAPGFGACQKAKDNMYKQMTTIGEIIGAHHQTPSSTSTMYVVGKRKAKKAKERCPNLIVMYRTARTKGDWVEYKGE